jgi:hypothetical protein
MFLHEGIVLYSAAETHHFYAAPGKNFDAASDPPAPVGYTVEEGKIFKMNLSLHPC